MMTVVWSKISQAWLIMWNDVIIGVKNSKVEVVGWMTEHGYTTIDYQWKE